MIALCTTCGETEHDIREDVFSTNLYHLRCQVCSTWRVVSDIELMHPTLLPELFTTLPGDPEVEEPLTIATLNLKEE